jgi:hypothetical protein
VSDKFDEIAEQNQFDDLTIPARRGALRESFQELRTEMEAEIIVNYADDPLRQQDWLDLLEELGGNLS